MPSAEARAPLPVLAAAAAAIAIALAACSGDAPTTTPFSPEDLGPSSTDLPELAGPERDAVRLEIIVYTSPTPARPGEPRYGGALRVAWTGPVVRLDPVTTNAWTAASEYHSAAVGSHLFESLLRWDEHGAARPSLIDSWSVSADGLSYTFRLRDGVTFHDASPVTSEDVRLSLDRWKATGSTQSAIVRKFAPSSWLQTPEADTLVATLQRPLPSFIDLLAAPHLSPYVMPRAQAFRQPRRTVRELVGTGPYAFTAWRPGESVEIDRFRDYSPRAEPASGYWGEQRAWIDRISWLNVPDPGLQVAGLLAGNVDVIDGADLSSIGSLGEDPAVRVLRARPGMRSVAYLNPASPIFQDELARLAAQAAVDAEAAMEAMGDPELWALCPAVYWCGGELDVRDGSELYGGADLDRARGLLAGSPYAGETVVVMGAADSAWSGPLVGPVADGLEAAGFAVERLSTDYRTLGGLLQRSGNFQVLIGWYPHWSGGSPLTDPTLSTSSRLVIEDLDLVDLRNRYALEHDRAARLDIVREINRLRLERATAVLLGTFDHVIPVTADLRGMVLFALPHYANAWLER